MIHSTESPPLYLSPFGTFMLLNAMATFLRELKCSHEDFLNFTECLDALEFFFNNTNLEFIKEIY